LKHTLSQKISKPKSDKTKIGKWKRTQVHRDHAKYVMQPAGVVSRKLKSSLEKDPT
jgi:hypothetical protein